MPQECLGNFRQVGVAGYLPDLAECPGRISDPVRNRQAGDGEMVIHQTGNGRVEAGVPARRRGCDAQGDPNRKISSQQIIVEPDQGSEGNLEALPLRPQFLIEVVGPLSHGVRSSREGTQPTSSGSHQLG